MSPRADAANQACRRGMHAREVDGRRHARPLQRRLRGLAASRALELQPQTNIYGVGRDISDERLTS